MSECNNAPGIGRPTMCFGCRAIENRPHSPSDYFPGGPPFEGMKWETFTCERCGVTDVRMVPESGEGNTDG